MAIAAGQLHGSLDLEGARMVVAGGASGFGYAISNLFMANGARVAILDLDAERADQRVDERGEACIGLECDVSDVGSVASAVGALLATFDGVEVLINNAGLVSLAPAQELARSEGDKAIAVNLTRMFLMSQAIGKVMLAAGKGKIIFLASQAASVALEGHVAYCASKAGVLGLTKVLAYERAPLGVTVNAISPIG